MTKQEIIDAKLNLYTVEDLELPSDALIKKGVIFVDSFETPNVFSNLGPTSNLVAVMQFDDAVDKESWQVQMRQTAYSQKHKMQILMGERNEVVRTIDELRALLDKWRTNQLHK